MKFNILILISFILYYIIIGVGINTAQADNSPGSCEADSTSGSCTDSDDIPSSDDSSSSDNSNGDSDSNDSEDSSSSDDSSSDDDEEELCKLSFINDDPVDTKGITVPQSISDELNLKKRCKKNMPSNCGNDRLLLQKQRKAYDKV